MGIVTDQINKVLQEPGNREANLDVRRVVAKDVMISYLLSFIYNHKEYRKLVFYGGTCARVVYGLDRFSEDIDLDNSALVKTDTFNTELELYVKNQMQIQDADVYEQHGEGGIARWVVRAPVMHEIGLSPLPGEKLHVKVEMSTMPKKAVITKTPVIRHGQVMVITHFDKPSLMAGKMVACLERVWKKGATRGTEIKGRDFYDLIWYMGQKVEPNHDVLQFGGMESYTIDKAWEMMSLKVKNIDKRELEIDLKSFIPNGVYLKEWLDNFQDFYQGLLKKT
jgi:predicted nucleotidyltransferase component of viral defense system